MNIIEPKKRKITLMDIAKAAGVSKSTVSLVLRGSDNPFPISPATRERVMETARQMGYRPSGAARSLVTGRAHSVLLVSFGSWDPNLIERMRGMEASFVPHSYSTMLCTVFDHEDMAAYHDLLRSGRADGVILTGGFSRINEPMLAEMYELAHAFRLPVVAVANAFPSQYIDLVIDIDDEKGAEMIVTHMIGLGHKRIGLLRMKDQPWADKRERGYKKALEAAGIEVDPTLIFNVEPANDLADTAYRTVLNLDLPLQMTALFAGTDYYAIAALSALKNKGLRIPEDCAVVGFDNNETFARYTDPPLTTVAHPFHEEGRLAAQAMLDLIDGKRVDPPPPLPMELVIRKSCGTKA